MGNHEHWPFDDPARFEGSEAERLESTRAVRNQLDQRVREWLASMNLQLAAS